MHFLCSSFTAIQDPAKKLKQHHNFPIFFRGSAAKNCRKMLLLGLEHSSLRDAAQQFYLSCQDNVFRRECTNYSPLKKPMKYPQYSKITQNVSFWSVSETEQFSNADSASSATSADQPWPTDSNAIYWFSSAAYVRPEFGDFQTLCYLKKMSYIVRKMLLLLLFLPDALRPSP